MTGEMWHVKIAYDKYDEYARYTAAERAEPFFKQLQELTDL